MLHNPRSTDLALEAVPEDIAQTAIELYGVDLTERVRNAEAYCVASCILGTEDQSKIALFLVQLALNVARACQPSCTGAYSVLITLKVLQSLVQEQACIEKIMAFYTSGKLCICLKGYPSCAGLSTISVPHFTGSRWSLWIAAIRQLRGLQEGFYEEMENVYAASQDRNLGRNKVMT